MAVSVDARSFQHNGADGGAISLPELAGLRDLLEQLVIEFKRVEAWAQSSCNHELRPELRVSAVGEPLHCNGDAANGVGHFSSLLVEHEDCSEHTNSEQNFKIEPQVTPPNEVADGAGEKPHAVEEIGQADEVVCLTELKMWFEKLLIKETKRHEVRALSPKYIHTLFAETDGDFTRDEVSIAETINCFNAAARFALEEPDSFTKAKTCFSSTFLSFEDKAKIPDGMLSFDNFVELMMWNKVEPHVNPKFKIKAMEIREVLIRHSVDELIFEFSGLTPAMRTQPPPLYLRTIEPVVGLVVLMNALTIGISADNPWGGWEVLEAIYTFFFIGEIFLKLSVYGVRQHFFGREMAWNVFDFAIVSLAVFDLAVSYLVSSADSALSNFTLMRLARLAKITRLLRLVRIVRLRCFKELLLLVKGVVAGMRTLMWAFVLLATLVYIIGIMMRQTVGERQIRMGDQYGTVLFHSVPWSMFQTFRCFTDDCTLADGTPLLAHLYELYGYTFIIPWALATLFVTFGVFNLIMAVFVENVQENAKMKRQLTREDERARVVSRMRELVMIFGGKGVNEEPFSSESSSSLRNSLSSRLGLPNSSRETGDPSTRTKVDFQFGGIITRDMFNKVISQPGVHDILDDLEVHVADRSELFDLLDADRSNSVDVSELIHGILKLRSGGADKSDIVATILGIRSLQKQINVFMETSFEHQANIRNDLKLQIDELKRARSDWRSSARGPYGGSSGGDETKPKASL